MTPGTPQGQRVLVPSHVRSTALLLEAARQAGVRRVVLASSNHAVGFTPRVASLPATPPPPDTHAGEVLAGAADLDLADREHAFVGGSFTGPAYDLDGCR